MKVVDEPRTCPTPEVLLDFRAGLLPDAEMECLAAHLVDCSSCSVQLEKAAATDPLLGRLRFSLGAAAVADEEACAAVAARVRRIWDQDPSLTDTRYPAAAREVAIPKLLGPYEILEPLNGGGMGDLYKARHTLLKKVLALKTLTPDRASDQGAIARFRREMEASGAIPDHPHIVRATDANEDRSVHFLVMDYIPGVDLGRLAAARGPLPIADACELVRQAALGLAHLHAHGLVHRDVKPSNLILSTDGVVKVLDLGLALLPNTAEKDDPLTATWTLMGTADYMAPEQIFDAHNVGPAVDLYSLGCTLFKLLTGRAPFEDEMHPNRSKKLRAQSMEPPPRVRDFRPEAPAELDELVGRLLAKASEQRGSAKEFGETLTPFATANTIFLLVQEDGDSRARQNDAEEETPAVLKGKTVSITPRPMKSRLRKSRLVKLGLPLAFGVALLIGAVVLATRGLGERKEKPELVYGRPVHAFEHRLNKISFTNLTDGSQLSPDRERDQLALNYFGGQALVECGQSPPDTGFTIEVGIRQAPWVTHSGVFFGYQELPQENGQAVKWYQIIALYAFPSGPGTYWYELKRLLRWERGASSEDVPLASRIVAPPDRGRRYDLSLQCSREGSLMEVRWAGAAVPELVTPQENNKRPVPSSGRFGIFQINGSATYHSFRYMLGEEIP